MNLVIKIVLQTAAIFVAAKILPYVIIADLYTALLVSIIFSIINTFIKPVLQLLTLPISLLTLGLFSVILNGLLVLVVTRLVPGFEITSLLWAIVFSFVVSIVTSVLESVFN